MVKRPTPISKDILDAWIAIRGRQYQGELERLLQYDIDYDLLGMPERVFKTLMHRIRHEGFNCLKNKEI